MEEKEKTVEQVVEKVRSVTGFKMENLDKVTRALFGSPGSKGDYGGVGEGAEPKIVLAEYDRLNGYITKQGIKVKNRTFFDAKTKLPVEKPTIVYLVKVNGEMREYKGELSPGKKSREELEMKIALQDSLKDE